MRSVWFIVPAWQRPAVTALSLAQRAHLAEGAAAYGLDVQTVVVASDENLDVAAAYGCETVELGNEHLGRKFNAGFRHAADQGADYLVLIGSDNWLHPSALMALDDDAVLSGMGIAFVDLGRDRAQPCSYGDSTRDRPGRRHGIIPWVFPRETLAPSGFAPLPDEAPRGIDHLFMKGVHASGVRPRWHFHDPHPFARVDFKSSVNLNSYARVAGPLADGPEVDLDALAEHYPAALVDMARQTSA